MRILVIGGTGFIGSFVTRRLRDSAHDVTVFHRGRSTQSDLDVRHILGEHDDLPRFADEFRSLRPDVAVDMILGSERNAADVVGVMRGVATRLVVASSIDVYRAYGRVRGFEPGPPDPTPLNEDSPLRERLEPHSPEEIASYLPTYLEEFEFRFNRRKMGDAKRFAALMSQTQGRLTWFCQTPQAENPHA